MKTKNQNFEELSLDSLAFITGGNDITGTPDVEVSTDTNEDDSTETSTGTASHDTAKAIINNMRA